MASIVDALTPEASSKGATETIGFPRDGTLLSALKMTLTSAPVSGYFVAGGMAGLVSRTATAPLDRLKVYLIAQTDSTKEAVQAAKKGAVTEATKKTFRPLVDASKALWEAGGVRSLFAGMYDLGRSYR